MECKPPAVGLFTEAALTESMTLLRVLALSLSPGAMLGKLGWEKGMTGPRGCQNPIIPRTLGVGQLLLREGVELFQGGGGLHGFATGGKGFGKLGTCSAVTQEQGGHFLDRGKGYGLVVKGDQFGQGQT